MGKICPVCGKPVPPTRKKNAIYCSDEHYYQAKRERSTAAFHANKKTTTEIKRNIKILDRFVLFIELNIPITFDYMDKLKFNWGVSTGEISNDAGLIFKEIGDSYAYHIKPASKNIMLWVRRPKK